MDINYKNKYLIYKQKYLQLKQLISEQTGGVLCSICGSHVRTYEELILHKRQKHGLELSPIDIKRMKNAESAKKHRDEVRLGHKGSYCSYCDIAFYDRRYLAVHLIRDHRDVLNENDLKFVKDYIGLRIQPYKESIRELEQKFGTQDLRGLVPQNISIALPHRQPSPDFLLTETPTPLYIPRRQLPEPYYIPDDFRLFDLEKTTFDNELDENWNPVALDNITQDEIEQEIEKAELLKELQNFKSILNEDKSIREEEPYDIFKSLGIENSYQWT